MRRVRLAAVLAGRSYCNGQAASNAVAQDASLHDSVTASTRLWRFDERCSVYMGVGQRVEPWAWHGMAELVWEPVGHVSCLAPPPWRKQQAALELGVE